MNNLEKYVAFVRSQRHYHEIRGSLATALEVVVQQNGNGLEKLQIGVAQITSGLHVAQFRE